MCAGKDVDYKNIEVIKKYIEVEEDSIDVRLFGNDIVFETVIN